MAENDQSALDAMAARVGQKVTAEKAELENAPSKDVITPDFVKRCASYAEKGDGTLHSALLRDRLVYVPEIKTWFQWTPALGKNTCPPGGSLRG